LTKHGFLSVPVLQKKGLKYYGSVDLLDIVVNVVDTFGKTNLEKSENYWELVQKDEEFQSRLVNKIMSKSFTIDFRISPSSFSVPTLSKVCFRSDPLCDINLETPFILSPEATPCSLRSSCWHENPDFTESQ
jgi:hypothetical protein